MRKKPLTRYERKAEPPTAGDVGLVLGLGLLIYAFAPPDVRRAVVQALKKTPTPPADLSAKYPNATDVN